MNQATPAGREFNVAQFIDDHPIGWREIMTLVIVSIVLFIDGFDMYFLGKIAPAVAEGLGAHPEDMGTVFVPQQIGMAIGAFLMPPLADRIGRKPVLALCLAVFGLLSFWSILSTSLEMLAVLRGVSGIFYSAMLPIALALLSEMTPRRRRASFLSIALVCFSGGNLASGAMTAWLLDIYGWTIGFWLGGILPLMALPLLLLIPESIPFRVTRNPSDPRIAPAILRISPRAELYGGEVFTLGQKEKPESAGPFAMFGKRYRVQTILLFAACFFAMGNIALLANWLATWMQELGGISIQDFAIYMMIGFGGGAAGTLSMGWLMDRVNPYYLIATFFLIDAAALVTLGFLPGGSLMFIVMLVVWNYCQVGGQTGINTLATLGYPPEMRSSGIGWAGGTGRVGGILFPALGGYAITLTFSLETIMMLTAIPALLIAVLILVLGAAMRRQESQQEEARPLPA